MSGEITCVARVVSGEKTNKKTKQNKTKPWVAIVVSKMHTSGINTGKEQKYDCDITCFPIVLITLTVGMLFKTSTVNNRCQG